MVGKAEGGLKLRIGDSTVNIENNNSAPHPAALADILETFWGNFKSIFDKHQHPTGVGPSGPPTAQGYQAPVFDENIKSTKVNLPSN